MPRRSPPADFEQLVSQAVQFRTQVLAGLVLELGAAEEREEMALGERTEELLRQVLALSEQIDRCSFNFRGRVDLHRHVMAAATQLRMGHEVARGVASAARRRLEIDDRHRQPRRRGRPLSWGRQLVARLVQVRPGLTADELLMLDDRLSAGGADRFLIGRSRDARRRDARRLLALNRE